MNTDHEQRFKDLVNSVKIREGKTFTEIAATLGITKNHLSSLMHGKYPIPLNLAVKAVNIFEDSPYILNEPAANYGKANDQNACSDFDDCDLDQVMAGNDMEPDIQSGDRMMLRSFKDSDNLVWGHIYHISTPDFKIVRRVFPGTNKGELILRSTNPKYPDMYIKKDSIKSIHILKGLILKRII